MLDVKGLRAGIYLRISDDREGQAVGVQRQEEDTRQLAERQGWSLQGTFSDNDISATSGRKRPAWERLLKELESGRIEAVAAYSSSRMYRRPRDLQRLIDILQKRPSIEVATVVSGKLDLSTADGRMLAGILAQVDQAEAERIGERVSRQKRSAREDGAWNGGQRPFGYELAPEGGLTLLPLEAGLIKEAAARIISGESLNRISSDWRDRGIKTVSGSGWKPSFIRRLLLGDRSRPTLRGTPLVLGGRSLRATALMNDGNWPAILSMDEVSAIRAQLDGSAGRNKTLRRQRRYVLSGLLTCGLCGSKLLGTAGRYKCAKINGGCGKISIGARILEDLLDERIQRVREEGKAKDPSAFVTVAVDEEDQRAALAELAAIEAQIAETRDLVINLKMKPADATAILDGLESRRLAAAQEYVSVVPQGPAPYNFDFEDIQNFHERWVAGELTDTELNDLHDMFAAYIAEVRVGPGRPHTFDPKRILVRWQ